MLRKNMKCGCLTNKNIFYFSHNVNFLFLIETSQNNMKCGCLKILNIIRGESILLNVKKKNNKKINKKKRER